MTFRELPPKLTPLTYASVINALLLAWEVTGVNPTRAAVRLATAQIAIESGLTSCQNFNISGIKSRPNNGKTCWQYFATTERFDAAQLAEAQRVGPGLVDVINPNDNGLIRVRVRPKHPYCCFRALEGLDDAMRDHLLTLRDKFPRAWAALQTGDPAQFAHGLKVDRYYTATETAYEQGLEWRLKQELAAVPDSALVWGDVT
jgi:hypothetical protein